MGDLVFLDARRPRAERPAAGRVVLARELRDEIEMRERFLRPPPYVPTGYRLARAAGRLLGFALVAALGTALVEAAQCGAARGAEPPRLPTAAEQLAALDVLDARLFHGREIVARAEALAFLRDPAAALGHPTPASERSKRAAEVGRTRSASAAQGTRERRTDGRRGAWFEAAACPSQSVRASSDLPGAPSRRASCGVAQTGEHPAHNRDRAGSTPAAATPQRPPADVGAAPAPGPGPSPASPSQE